MFATAGPEEYRAIFWNLESGDSSDATLAAQMAEKGNGVLWGLSEVVNEAAVDAFEDALEDSNPGVDFVAKLSEDGGGDRLAILYRSDRLTAVPYGGTAAVDDIGDSFFEVDGINVGGTVRPAPGIQLEAETGDQLVVLVNHRKCCGGGNDQQRRKEQAIQMNAFAIETPGVPIVSGGDFNIPLDSGGQSGDAFQQISQMWEYREPQPNVGTRRSGRFLMPCSSRTGCRAGARRRRSSKRSGSLSAVASSRSFSDNASGTDHRPVLLVVESDVGERLDGMREAIADLEAVLESLKAELARLEVGN